MLKTENPNCDGGHCRTEFGEVRILPTGGESNAILCKNCFLYEMQYRRYRNVLLAEPAKFDLPLWDDLEIYHT